MDGSCWAEKAQLKFSSAEAVGLIRRAMPEKRLQFRRRFRKPERGFTVGLLGWVMRE